MPLDVQPLSPARRAVSLLLLLGLLGASLGFADYLVTKRQVRRAQVNIIFPAPRGVKEIPINFEVPEDPDELPLKAGAKWKGGEREFTAFEIDTRGEAPHLWSYYLDPLMEAAVGEPVEIADAPEMVTMGGRPAVQRRVFVRSEDPYFIMARLTVVEERLVAFCFSGVGPPTEDDIRFFDDYCDHSIKIVVDAGKP